MSSSSRPVTTAAAPPCAAAGPRTGRAPVGSMRRDRPLDGADLDDVADLDRDVLAAVDRDERLVRVDDPAADDLLRAHDDRADGRQVGGDRRHDEVAADRVEDRAAGRERVARWSRSGSTTTRPSATNVARCVSSMATSRRHTRASDAARDDEVVERDVADAVDRPAVAQDPALERHAFVDPVVARHDAPEHGVEVAGLGLREEADLAQVDARGSGRRPRRSARAARRNVPSPPRTTSASVVGQLARAGRRGRPPAPASARSSRTWHQPAARALQLDRPPRSSGCRRTRCA